MDRCMDVCIDMRSVCTRGVSMPAGFWDAIAVRPTRVLLRRMTIDAHHNVVLGCWSWEDVADVNDLYLQLVASCIVQHVVP